MPRLPKFGQVDKRKEFSVTQMKTHQTVTGILTLAAITALTMNAHADEFDQWVTVCKDDASITAVIASKQRDAATPYETARGDNEKFFAKEDPRDEAVFSHQIVLNGIKWMYEHPDVPPTEVYDHVETNCVAAVRELLREREARTTGQVVEGDTRQVIQAICRRAGLVGVRLSKARDRGVSLGAIEHELKNPPTPEDPETMELALTMADFIWAHPKMSESKVRKQSYSDCLDFMASLAKKEPSHFTEYFPIRPQDEQSHGEDLEK
jgi:hypothetical protein